ncbi:hypothetical protein Fcan01_27245 [Folsomia candida]|uniref:Uncharacterized protein n=1 Tax=Folsomia candida TaxID=158441 RepID=A0A226CZL5_FOLCA|nr:hypothetical protein Fcan01_27245 [Folsomia candida]
MGAILMPFMAVIYSLLRPCMPPVLTSVIFPNCKSWDDDAGTSFSARLFGSIMMGCVAFPLLTTVIFSIAVVMVYPTVVKLVLIQTMMRDLNRQTENTLLMSTYRILQILTDMHNSVLRQPITATLVGAITICQTFALYILITATSIVPGVVVFFFFMIALEMFIIIMGAFKILANPFLRSVELLYYMERKSGSKWGKRFVRSCPPSKVTLGDGKFFDRATSLVIWRTSVDYLITFLLT